MLQSGRDLDTKTSIFNTGLPFDNDYVGYSFGSEYVQDSTNKYLWWGGDNQSGSENVLIDFKLLHRNNPSLIKSFVSINAHWFNGSGLQSIEIKMIAYKGNVPTQILNYDFVNNGFEVVGEKTFSVVVSAFYEDLGFIEYDSRYGSAKLTKLK